MEPRRKPAARNTRSGVNKVAAGKNSAGHPFHLPHIADLIEDGEITIGTLRPVGCVATARDGDSSLAMLVRRKGDNCGGKIIRPLQSIRNDYGAVAESRAARN